MAWQLYDGWDGAVDGNWSTFELRVGSPPQVLPATVSTSISWLWLPFYDSPPCLSDIPGQSFNCSDHKLRDVKSMYQPCGSSTSQNYADCERFSDVFDDGAPRLHESVLSQTRLLDGFIQGHDRDPRPNLFDQNPKIGLLPRIHAHYAGEALEKTLYSHGSPSIDRADSFIQSFSEFYLDEKERPLNLVYGYTAGAWYKNYPASLTIGGIDPSRIGDETRTMKLIPFDFGFRPGGISEAAIAALGVQLISLTASDTLHKPNGTERSNYLEPFPLDGKFVPQPKDHASVELDPNLPYLQLPREVCIKLAEDFELDYDNSAEDPLFFVSNTTRARLRHLRPSFTFTIRDDLLLAKEHVRPINITLPYEAFEHHYTTPWGEVWPNFPIRMFSDDSQYSGYVLGRPFFQEAYIAVDFSNFLFNISKAAFPEPRKPYLDENMIFFDRLYNSSYPDPLDPRLAIARFQWLVHTFNWALIVSLTIFLVHIVLPQLLALPKKWFQARRTSRRERLWIALHVESWPHARGRNRQPRAQMRAPNHPWWSKTLSAAKDSFYAVGCLVWRGASYLVPAKHRLSRSATRVTDSDHIAEDVDGDLIDMSYTNEVDEERRREEEEWRLIRQTSEIEAQRRTARRRGAEAGKQAFEVFKNYIVSPTVQFLGLAFTWSNPLADFKERQARKRAARQRERRDITMIDR